eukprot:CAMPEP_0180164252 /NCGR_PEP_ID=MMETSP0986-20121125/30269_1 /TAXON_ID=697907 /ORGANISM="non described non described, Strain CCMP2293" /LENGTH=36 /DNA_ID= /DNA_START= /DNA_END= /DNA_ORIENTATION=
MIPWPLKGWDRRSDFTQSRPLGGACWGEAGSVSCRS